MRSLLAFTILLALQFVVAPALLVATEAVTVARADQIDDSGLEDTGYLPPDASGVPEGEGCPFLEAHAFLACPYLASIHAGGQQQAGGDATSATCPWAVER